MRIAPALLLLLCLPPASHALLEDWYPDPASYGARDTVFKTVNATNDSFVERFVVTARDSQGRPLSSELETLREGQDSYVSAFDFSWSFDLGWSPMAGVVRCPARVVETRVIGLDCMREYLYDYAWNPDRRSLVATQTLQTPLCRWTDSLTFDEQGRIVEHRTCQQVYRTTSSATSTRRDTVGLVTIKHMGYDLPTDRHPRWIASHDEDTAKFYSWDSVHVLGPVDRPTGAELSDGGRDYTYMIARDSIARDAQGRILSVMRRYRTAADSSVHPLELREYLWKGDLVVEERRTRWGVRDSVIHRYLATLSYGDQMVGSTRRNNPRSALPLRVANGRLRLELSDARPATIHWVGLDGRTTLLHRGPARTTLVLAAPRRPGFLRIDQGGRVSTLRMPPL